MPVRFLPDPSDREWKRAIFLEYLLCSFSDRLSDLKTQEEPEPVEEEEHSQDEIPKLQV